MHKIEYPPAFPFQPLNLQGEPSFPEYGMTLRDWFAGQALTGMIAAGANFHEHKETAKNAFDFADAMLACAPYWLLSAGPHPTFSAPTARRNGHDRHIGNSRLLPQRADQRSGDGGHLPRVAGG